MESFESSSDSLAHQDMEVDPHPETRQLTQRKRIKLFDSMCLDSVVMPFYGYLHEAYLLMSRLWRQTRNLWIDWEEIFMVTNTKSEVKALTFDPMSNDHFTLNSVALKYTLLGVDASNISSLNSFSECLKRINQNEPTLKFEHDWINKRKKTPFRCISVTIDDLKYLKYLSIRYTSKKVLIEKASNQSDNDVDIAYEVMDKYIRKHFDNLHITVHPHFKQYCKLTEMPVPYIDVIEEM